MEPEDDYNPLEVLSDKDFAGLVEANGGRVRSGPGGKRFVFMPVENFKHVVRSLLHASREDQKLLAAIIDQEGGAVMLHKRFVDAARPRGLFIQQDEKTGAQTIRHLGGGGEPAEADPALRRPH